MSALLALVADGPCAGSYDVRRITERMAFTVDRFTGQQFALDEDGDTIEETEDAYVYEAKGGVGWICGRGPGLPARTVTLEYAGELDAGTGEFAPASEAELEEIRRAGRKRMLALAMGHEPGERSKAAAPAEAMATTQGALF